MAKLTEEQKRFIVMELAMWSTPSEVVAAVKEEFGVEISRQHADSFNPETKHSYKVSKKWVTLHAETRKRFIADVTDIPIANKAYRLRMLQRLTQQAVAGRNRQQAGQFLEQAAKEVGESFTNRREVTGKDRGPMEFRNLSDEALDERLGQLMGRAALPAPDGEDAAGGS